MKTDPSPYPPEHETNYTRSEDSHPRLARWHHRFVRCLRWLFVKRLAIKPSITDRTQTMEDLTANSITIYEWQTLPKGYRWF